MMKSIKPFLMGRRWPLMATALAAVAARSLVIYEFLGTPLDFYSKIDGLDMKAIRAQGESFHACGGFLSMHRLLTSFCMSLNGGVFSHFGLMLAQMLLGTLSAVMICSVSMRIGASRIAALAAGLLAATYAPAILYETMPLKETLFIFLSCLSLWTLLWTAQKKAGIWRMALHGIVAAALPLSRFYGLLWSITSILWLAARSICPRRFTALWIPGTVFALSLAFVLLRSLATSGECQIFEASVNYNLQLGAEGPSAASYSVTNPELKKLGSLELLCRASLKVPQKALSLFRASQPTDNLNYYFMKEVLPALGALPGPMLLIPLGTAGLLAGVFFGWRRLLGIQSLPLFFFASFALPICMFVPTGRHMLALYPAFCIGAGIFAARLASRIRMAREKRATILIPGGFILLWVLLTWQAIPQTPPLRVSDFITYGLAAEMKYGFNAITGECFMKAIQLDPESESAGINLGKWLIDAKRPHEAACLMLPMWQRNPVSYKLMLNCSTAMLMSGDYAEALKMLEAFQEPSDPSRKEKYLYNLGEARRLCKASGLTP